MLFDSTCTVLDVQIMNFSAMHRNNNAELKWEVSNNKEAVNFEIEYSLNNRNFTKLAVLNASNETDRANYLFRYPFLSTANPVVFYRIKVTGIHGKVKYSNIIALRNKGIQKNEVTVFPNPTSGEAWLSFKASQNELAELSIWNAQGKRVSYTRIAMHVGENILKLPPLAGKPTGIYFVKTTVGNKQYTNKIYLVQ